jgi:alanyl-tRNA synthetase
MRASLASLQKTAADEAKRVAAANKAAAVTAAVAAAEAAAEAGRAFAVALLDVGLDGKAAQEAWNAVQKKHPALSAAFFSAGDDKALVYVGVTKEASSKLPAGEWLKEAMVVLGGKGGGKPTSAQGLGPKVGAISEAMQAAEKLAALKL